MRHMIAITLCCVAGLPLALTASPVHAGDSPTCRIGDLTRVFGGVQIVRDGSAIVPQSGDAFCAGDRFVTAPKGVAELKFRDGSEITVGKNTDLAIERWQERRFFANTATFSLMKGAFRALTGAITQRRHKFEVKTTVATIGVRGTEFWGGLNLTPDALEVVMLAGRGVYVQNNAGKIELTSAGTGTTVQAGKTPAAPNAWSPEKIKRAVATITP